MRGSRQGWLAATLMSLALGLHAVHAGDPLTAVLGFVTMVCAAGSFAGLGRP